MQSESNYSLPEELRTAQLDISAAHTDKPSFFKRLWNVKYLLWCFFLPAALMWLIYIAMKVYPFGEESVLVLDLNAQYVYYFEWLRRLLHGEGSFLYTFERTLGSTKPTTMIWRTADENYSKMP